MSWKKILNKSEEKIMDLLWDVGEPMTISEIEERLQGDNISKATLFKAIQALSVKKYICVNGVERATKTYARRFATMITREEYAAILLKDKGIDTNSIGDLIVAMIGSNKNDEGSREVDEKVIQELESIIIGLRNRD